MVYMPKDFFFLSVCEMFKLVKAFKNINTWGYNHWNYHNTNVMQPSMDTLNSLSSRIVKDSTPFRLRILRYISFRIGES